MPTPLLRILLVEDDPRFAALMIELIHAVRPSLNAVVTTVTLLAGAEARLGERWDIILLDLNLPDSRNAETFARIASVVPQVPVAVITADSSEELASRLLQAGAQDYLVKGTFNGELLRRSILYSIERNRMRQHAAFAADMLQNSQERVRLSDERFEAQYRYSPVPSFTWQHGGDDFMLADLNDAALKLTVGRAAAIIGRAASVVYAGNPIVVARLRECFERRVPLRDADITYRFYTSPRTARMSMTYTFVPPDLVMLQLEDLSDRIAAEENLRKLEQSQRLASLGRVAATIAHETNNVLMGIQPFGEIIRRQAPDDPVLQNAAMQITRTIQRGKRVTQEILRFTQPAHPVFQPLDVHLLFEEFRGEAMEMLGESIAFELELVDEPMTIEADRDQLKQVLMNLLINARDAIGAAGTIFICVKRREAADPVPWGAVTQPGPHVHIAFRDTGCGMPPEVRQHVFEPLFTTKARGTGLGLAVVHQLVTSHRGDVFAESEPGMGTTFHLLFPRAEPLVVPFPAGPPAETKARPARVLLVEDDPSVALGISTLMEMDGIEVRHVIYGAEVLEAVAESHPDVIVLDVGLPDMPGTEVYAAVVCQWPDIPVIFSTGQGDERAVLAFLDRPHTAYLLKPYVFDTLMETIEQVMA